MISEKLPESQEFDSLIYEEKKILNVQANKKFKTYLSKLPDFSFDNDTVTAFGNFVCLDRFKDFIDLKGDIKNLVNFNRGDNIQYSDFDIIDHIIDSNLVGKHSFLHYNDLLHDPGFLRIKDTNSLPEESTVRKVLDKIDVHNINELKEVMNSLLTKKSKLDGPREVWISVDDTVSVLHGKQQKGSSGYNPKRKGANSYKIKVAFIQDSDELVNISLYPGKVHSNGQFIDFLKETIDNLPKNTVLKGILADKGFFSEDNFEWLESNQIKYLIKGKMYSSLKRQAISIPEDNWQYVGNGYYVAEKRYHLDSWKHDRRFIFIRYEKLVEPKNDDQMSLPGLGAIYSYQAIVTNLQEDINPEDCWHRYNQRAIIENKIEEIKNGFAVNDNSQRKFLKNYIDILIKSISYNIFNWFKQALLPADLMKASIRTIRRIFINIPANIVKKGGRKYTVRLPDLDYLQNIVENIKDRLFMFAFRQCYFST